MKRVLVVDDDPHIADIMTRILEQHYEVLRVEDGLHAVEASHRTHIDLIVMDVHMPNFSGLWYCRAFKDKAQTRNIPIVFVSGDGDEEVIQKAYALGACAYLKKPFIAEDLLGAVEKNLR